MIQITHAAIFSQATALEDDFFDSVDNEIQNTILHEQKIYDPPVFQEGAVNSSIPSTIDHSQLIFDEPLIQESATVSVTSSISHAIP